MVSWCLKSWLRMVQLTNRCDKPNDHEYLDGITKKVIVSEWIGNLEIANQWLWLAQQPTDNALSHWCNGPTSPTVVNHNGTWPPTPRGLAQAWWVPSPAWPGFKRAHPPQKDVPRAWELLPSMGESARHSDAAIFSWFMNEPFHIRKSNWWCGLLTLMSWLVYGGSDKEMLLEHPQRARKVDIYIYSHGVKHWHCTSCRFVWSSVLL